MNPTKKIISQYFLVLFAGPQDPFKHQAKLGDPNDSDDEYMGSDDDEEEEEDEEDEDSGSEGDVVYGDPAARSVADSQQTVQVGNRKRKVQLSEREKRGRNKVCAAMCRSRWGWLFTARTFFSPQKTALRRKRHKQNKRYFLELQT